MTPYRYLVKTAIPALLGAAPVLLGFAPVFFPGNCLAQTAANGASTASSSAALSSAYAARSSTAPRPPATPGSSASSGSLTAPRSASPTSSSAASARAHRSSPAVIGYYAGRDQYIDSFATGKLTHIIFSFCHLKGNLISVQNANDSTIIRHLVSLKTANPRLRVIISLGGWGGCPTCSAVFSTDTGRSQFVQSVKELSDYFHTDGIDLDWEYPALVNVPGYAYSPADRGNFTALIQLLRRKLGKHAEISFAAGGYTAYLTTSIDWKEVTPQVDYINLMTYDLVSGYDTITGHHTPLYSTPQQLESTDHAVRWLDSVGVPMSKIAIGVAFYGRIWGEVDSVNNGLYRHGYFQRGVSYKDQALVFSPDSGYVTHWDPVAQAPYKYNAAQKLFATYDDTLSIRLKTQYVLDKRLGGIMFWQLPEDRFHDGLLDVIDNTLHLAARKRE